MKTILVVDDMAIFREPIAATLRREGYNTLSAENGQEALQIAIQQPPDLILLDLAMPVMDGLKCLELLRRNPTLRTVPVIVLTAMSTREAIIHSAHLGVQGYMLKSRFSLEDLLTRITTLLGEAPAGEERAGRSRGAPGRPAPARPAAGTAADHHATSRSEPHGDSVPGEASDEASGETGSGAESIEPLSETRVIEQVCKDATLRAVPPVLKHIIALTNNPSSTLDEIAGAVRHDQALTLKVMRIANSSFYGRGKTVHTITEAAQRIGVSGVRNCILAIMAIEHFGEHESELIDAQRFWEHALATASLAEQIGASIGLKTKDQLFLAGLLHDAGRMTLCSVFPDHYRQALARAGETGAGLVAAERELFNLCHADVTREVLTKWELHPEVVEPAWLHEMTVSQIKRSGKDAQSALVVALANRLAHALIMGDSGEQWLLPVREFADALSLKRETMLALARGTVEKAGDILLFYASKSDESLVRSRAGELTRRVREHRKIAVVEAGLRDDAILLLLEQLGWADQVEPDVALLQAEDERQLVTAFAGLRALEDDLERRLPVLLLSPDGEMQVTDEILDGRVLGQARLPGTYQSLIEAITAVYSAASAALAAAPE